jgi:hypothetical protein
MIAANHGVAHRAEEAERGTAGTLRLKSRSMSEIDVSLV